MFDATFLLTGYAAATPTLADNVRFLTTYPQPIGNIAASAMSMSARSTRPRSLRQALIPPPW
jgi:hypothetical protein